MSVFSRAENFRASFSTSPMTKVYHAIFTKKKKVIKNDQKESKKKKWKPIKEKRTVCSQTLERWL